MSSITGLVSTTLPTCRILSPRLPLTSRHFLHHVWDKQPRYPLLILDPRFPVFGPTLLDISDRSVHNHASEEQRIEPWEG
jgi:hypothetical protein